MGIEIIEKDSLYLHFIRSFISLEGKARWGELLFSEQESIYRKITSELQDTCQLFDVFAFVIGEQTTHGDLLGKIWFEAKMKNNTNYTFKEPIVTFMTIKNTNNHLIQNEQNNSFLEVGTVLMSSLDDVSWKPDKTPGKNTVPGLREKIKKVLEINAKVNTVEELLNLVYKQKRLR